MSLLFHSCFTWLQEHLAEAMHCIEIFIDSLILVPEKAVKLHGLTFLRLKIVICLGLQKLSKKPKCYRKQCQLSQSRGVRACFNNVLQAFTLPKHLLTALNFRFKKKNMDFFQGEVYVYLQAIIRG